MANYDVFNGDADGICALQQLRLNDPIESKLITGVKRDIQLLDHVEIRVPFLNAALHSRFQAVAVVDQQVDGQAD